MENMTEEVLCATSSVRLPVSSDGIMPERSEEFVVTPAIEALTDRAMAYLEVGYPVHFAGSAGTGKTTLAFHVAARLGRPVILIHGDDEFGSSDLIGKNAGYRKSRTVDNFIHSVLRAEEEMQTLWVDNRLTTACQNGCTLVYDEFNRSRPEANNALLSILSERILNLPNRRFEGEGYLQVNPNFHAIFTSNPEEYAGTHKTQDALMDRLITIELQHYDRETEIGITRAHSGISQEGAETIVDIVRALRELGPGKHRPTIRSCIAIARVVVHQGSRAHGDDPAFTAVCHDILSNLETARVTHSGAQVAASPVFEVIEKVCATRGNHKRLH
jgi:gas vesicle protein GvpN